MRDDAIDRDALRRLLDLVGGDPADLEELLEEYLQAAPALAATLTGAAARGDLGAMRIAAHTLRSNARDFGAHHLSQLCATLEAACRSGALSASEAEAAAAEISAAEARARQALLALAPSGQA